MKIRAWIWAACVAVALGALNLRAQSTNELADQIPPLRPPHVEIPPTYWEEHRSIAILGGAIVIVAVAGLVWLLTRPKGPPVLPPPATQARHDLETLARQPEDGAVLSRVSQILRRYITSALEFPKGEMTTADVCDAVAKDGRLGNELSADLTGFLRACDERKFAPPKPAPAIEAVPKALKFIETTEARLAQLQQAVATAPPVPEPVRGPTA